MGKGEGTRARPGGPSPTETSHKEEVRGPEASEGEVTQAGGGALTSQGHRPWGSEDAES